MTCNPRLHYEHPLLLFLLFVLSVSGYRACAQGRFLTQSTLPVGNGPDSVVAADVNGDGKLDLISANYLADTLTVLTNNDSGSFGFNATLHVGSGPWGVVAVGVNGDGKLGFDQRELLDQHADGVD